MTWHPRFQNVMPMTSQSSVSTPVIQICTNDHMKVSADPILCGKCYFFCFTEGNDNNWQYCINRTLNQLKLHAYHCINKLKIMVSPNISKNNTYCNSFHGYGVINQVNQTRIQSIWFVRYPLSYFGFVIKHRISFQFILTH